MNIKKLKTVKNYAVAQGVSTTWVYRQIDTGVLGSIKIDGVIFVVSK